MNDCIFCKIVAGRLPCVKLYETDQLLAFMDIRPGARGHCLLIPKRHAETLHEMDEATLALIGPALKKVADACKAGLGADGINLVQSNGVAAFQSVFHVHFHVVPRYEGDGIRLPWSPRPADPEELEAVAKSIRGRLSA